MDEKKANIDLVFRNGLKDYEVLPPPEVWNNIRPVIRKKQRPVIILRTAAVIAVLLSLSFLAYRWNNQINERLENNIITRTEESEMPVNNNIPDLLPVHAVSSENIPVIAEVYVPSTPEKSLPVPESSLNTVNNIKYQPAYGRISMNDQKVSGSDLIELYKTAIEEIKTENQVTLYSPVTTVKDKSDKWTISALVSPAYYTNFYSGKDEMTSQLVSNEKPAFSYSGGMAFSYKLNKRVSVQSGFYYSSFGQELSGITTFGGFQPYDYIKGDHNFEVLTASGKVYTNNTDIFLIDSRSDNRIITRYTKDFFDPTKANLQYLDDALRQNFSYLELPIIVKYKIIDKKIDFNLIGGLSSNILVNNSVYAAIDGSRYYVGKTEGLNLLTFSSSFGMGMEYNFSGNLSLNLEPTLRYYLNPFNEFSGIKSHPYSFGIFSGISYRF